MTVRLAARPHGLLLPGEVQPPAHGCFTHACTRQFQCDTRHTIPPAQRLAPCTGSIWASALILAVLASLLVDLMGAMHLLGIELNAGEVAQRALPCPGNGCKCSSRGAGGLRGPLALQAERAPGGLRFDPQARLGCHRSYQDSAKAFHLPHPTPQSRWSIWSCP